MKKVLIANRGEIAVRIARACRDYGLQSVAVYADADIDALHVRIADEAWGLDGQRPVETYLDIDKLLAIARQSGSDAVHPGYGFLSERADFAQAVIDTGLTWIGPDPDTLDALGDKVQARKIAQRVGAPLVAGTTEPVANVDQVLEFAEKVGLPIAIKAAFGGGGRGLKVAWRREEVAELYESAVREATAAFGRGECFLEKFLDRPRHIEAQILGDRTGNILVVGTRDCSLQRRNQKLIEEAPAPFLSDEQRQRIHQSARDICAAAHYVGAGTVEFLLSTDGTLSFLEVNTRLQVEHPVTEETTGIDLVVEQLRIAEGLPLSISETPTPRGHSFEFRINAEDAGKGFLPAPGRISEFQPPSGPGIRLDTGVTGDSVVPGTFDSMMAKLIVTGATRQQAIARARRALQEFSIDGVVSLLPFHQAVMAHPDFTSGARFNVHTRWIETDFDGLPDTAARRDADTGTKLLRTVIELDGRRCRLGLPTDLLHRLGALQKTVPTNENDAEKNHSKAQDKEQDNLLSAPLSGTLHAWLVGDGNQVAAGEAVAVMEAMKMETQVVAPCAGKLSHVAEAGTLLTAGSILGRIVDE